MTPSDYITEAKYDEFTCDIILKNNKGHKMIMDMRQVSEHLCHFIASAINEKIQREKGEKE